jgi:hypothetical protein
MTARPAGRTAPCGRAQALVRLRHAAKFLEVAEIVESEAEETPESSGVAAPLAVLAGIAACDAAHYGVIDVNPGELRSAVRHARALLEFAQTLMRA